jgi:hypothetical protein
MFVPATANGQVAWESPMLLPPAPQSGFGIFLADTWAGGLGVIGTWRGSSPSWGLRFGIAEDNRGPDDDIAALGGVDFMGRIHRSNAEFPLDVDWLFGAGGSVGDNLWLSFPLGLTLGHTFRGESADFVPFIAPRVVLDAFFIDEAPGDDSDIDLDMGVDLGLDLRLRSVTIRFAGSFGRDAVAVGIVF